LYQSANPKVKFDDIKLTIEETVLTGQQNYEKVMAQDTIWKTNEPQSMVQHLKQKPQDPMSLIQKGEQEGNLVSMIAVLEP